MRNFLLVDDFQPRSELIVPKHPVSRAKFPVVDAHNHLPMHGPQGRNVDLDELVRTMDFINLQTIVNLTGGTGDQLRLNLEKLDLAYPGRFATFCNVDWAGMGTPGWIEKTLVGLEADVDAGARGLKIFKELGLHVRDQSDHLVMPDDPRLAALWDRAGELSIPVLIHTADPVAFFRPLDRFNERRGGLLRRPEWHFYGPAFPPFQELIDSLYRVVEGHPKTTFITAHVGCYPENLDFVSQMLGTYPNLYTDISARIVELGRAPYSARKLFLEHPDRILFGTDVTPSMGWYQLYYRFMETDDQFFDPVPEGGTTWCWWKIYGLSLPDDVLERVYRENAAALLKL
ncbi:MAG: amidohydrolase family protein [Anaerolineae bacterium]|nr:amidohydrolase family protein [Anaerolineae bacterium]